MLKRIHITAPLEYISGYLKAGLLNGTIELDEEEFEEFKKNPVDFLYDNDYISELSLRITNYVLNDRGPIDKTAFNWYWTDAD